ncbi:hypothetical protein D3C81_1681440 [compost metagenome]
MNPVRNPGLDFIHVLLSGSQHIRKRQRIIGTGVEVEHIYSMVIGLIGLVSLHNSHAGKIILRIREPRTTKFKEILVVIDDINQIDRNILQAVFHHFEIGIDQVLI